jgi:biopolymer transport protein ExbD
MARNFRRRNTLASQSEINVTPLLDLAFSLLIIFMISTPLLEQSIEVNLPTMTTPLAPVTEKDFEVITVDQNGHYFWRDEAVTVQQLEERIAAAARRPTIPPVRIRGDFRVQYQEIVNVLDLLQKHQLTKINFDNTLR